MKIGKQGLDIIKSFEGLELKAYMPTPDDKPTIGYGHTKTVKMGQTITEKQAEALLKQDLAWVEAVVSKYIKVPLNQNQYDACCSFIYNVGEPNFSTSTFLRKLNSKDYQGAADQLPRWNKQRNSKGKFEVLRGLTRRREAEKALFLSKTTTPSPAPTKGPLAALIAALVAIFTNRGA